MSDTTTGVIHDIGYQHYTGPRAGRGYLARSLYTHSLRTAFGLGRGVKAKLFPWAAVSLVTLVALILTAVASQSGEKVSTYPEFVDAMPLPEYAVTCASAARSVLANAATLLRTLSNFAGASPYPVPFPPSKKPQ